MERESFDDAATAAVMNELFVNVKVDREERPDVDAVYMDAVVALTGQGGWPLTVFLTPDGEPFYGGTYFPPEPRHGLPAFRQVLRAVADAYRERPEDVAAQAGALVDALRRSAETEPSREPLTEALLTEAERGLVSQLDPRWGGFGRAPKFPPASVLEFLLRRGALDPVRLTLDGMAAGGMYDLVGGGFHRYSVDPQWLVPHFEKMLYDNALLVPPYLHAWLLTGEERYRVVAEQTLDYMVRELRLESGGFASSQDADTDGVEGLTYTWTTDEGAPPELLQPFEHGRSILRGELDDETRARLLEIRDRRPQPALDDKVIAAWNGLALAALAEGARRLDRSDLLVAASSSGSSCRPIRSGGRCATAARSIPRTSRTTRTSRTGCTSCTSRPAICAGCASRAELRSPRWSSSAIPNGAASSSRRPTASSSSRGRRRSTTTRRRRGARCSPSSCCGSRGSGATTSSSGRRSARSASSAISCRRAPAAFGWALCALDLHLSPPRELAVVGDPQSGVARAALRGFDPNAVVAFGPADDVPLLEGKLLVDGKPAVYVCERFACRAPVTDPAQLA